MNHLLFSKATVVVASLIAGGLLFPASLKAQPAPSNPSDTVYWDPTDSKTETTGGITGDFATSDFYDPTTNSDGQFVSGTNGVGVFSPGEGAIFNGPAGTVNVSAPVSPDYLEVGVTSGTETFGTLAGGESTITFPQGNGNQDSSPENTPTIPVSQYFNNAINIDAGSENVVFNSGLNFAEFNRYYNVSNTLSSSSTGNVAFNGGITFTNNVSAATADYPITQATGEPNMGLSGVAGTTFTINSAVTEVNAPGAVTTSTNNYGTPSDPLILTFPIQAPYVGLETNNTMVLTSNASLTGASFTNVNLIALAGTVFDQGATYSNTIGEQRMIFVGGTAQYLTDTAGMTVTAGVQFINGGGIVGSDLAATTTYSGQVIGYSGAAMELTSAAGGRVNFTGDVVNGNNDSIVKVGAGTINVNDANPYDENQGAGWEVKNGTMLINGNVANHTAITGSGLEIDNVATASLSPNVQTYAILGGNGSTAVAVTADGANSVITPGDPTVNKGIGTLTLAGGLSAENGITMNFTLDGTNPNSVIDLAGSILQLNGNMTFNFTNIGGVLALGKDYTIMTGINVDSDVFSNADDTYTFNAPAGYMVDASVYPVYNPDSGNNGTLTVQFEAAPEPSVYAMMSLGLLALIGIRRFRLLS